MKILLISDFFPPYVGGMENHVRNLAEQYSSLGHHVYVVTTDLEDKIETHNGVEIFRFRGLFQSLSFAFKNKSQRYPPPLVDPILMVKIRKLIQRIRPDAIHTHGWITNTAIAAKTGSKIPIITTLHDYSHICPKRNLLHYGQTCQRGIGLHCIPCSKADYGPVKSAMALIGIYSGLRKLKKISKFISVSSYVRKRYQNYFPDVSNVVIPNFMDPNKFANERSKTESFNLPKRFILFVGVLGSFKGPDDLISGFITAKSKTAGLSDTKLLILGKPHPEKKYQSIPEQDVEVINSPPRTLVVEALHKAACLVVPSRVEDACPTVILEGISTGIPIIGTHVGGIPELLENMANAWIVKPNSPKEIAERLVQQDQAGMFTNLPKRSAVSIDYLPLNPEGISQKILALYQEAIRNGES